MKEIFEFKLAKKTRAEFVLTAVFAGHVALVEERAEEGEGWRLEDSEGLEGCDG